MSSLPQVDICGGDLTAEPQPPRPKKGSAFGSAEAAGPGAASGLGSASAAASTMTKVKMMTRRAFVAEKRFLFRFQNLNLLECVLENG